MKISVCVGSWQASSSALNQLTRNQPALPYWKGLSDKFSLQLEILIKPWCSSALGRKKRGLGVQKVCVFHKNSVGTVLHFSLGTHYRQPQPLDGQMLNAAI